MMGVGIAPSLICADQCNLQREVERLEDLGVDMLHVDFLDSHFSPSLPLGIEAVRQLRSHTTLPFDIHLMVTNNEFFIAQMVDIGVQRLCFHVEVAPHVDRLLQQVAEAGISPGIALKPATPLSALEYCLERIDFVLLMLINPGFAGHWGETQIPYARRRVAACRQFLDERGSERVAIEIDGRVSFDNIPGLVAAGADILVAGSQSLFHSGGDLATNLVRMREAVVAGWVRRGSVGVLQGPQPEWRQQSA